MSITGISIGGGNIQIIEINGFPVKLNIGQPTFVILYQDLPGIVASVSELLAKEQINIGTITMHREGIGGDAIMMIEVDHSDAGYMAERFRNIPTIKSVNFFD